MKALVWIGNYVPFFMAGGVMIAMAISSLLRYSERFRNWWERHVTDRCLQFFERQTERRVK